MSSGEMACLLGLPDEMLVTILSYLIPFTKDDDWIFWSARTEELAARRFQQNRDFSSLQLTCRRLAVLVSPLVYRDISFDQSRGKLARFLKAQLSLVSNRPFATESLVGVSNFSMFSMSQIPLLLDLPSLPCLRRITLHETSCNDLPQSNRLHKSPITHVSVRSHASFLSNLLTYPRALDTLIYEYSFGLNGAALEDIALQSAALHSSLALHANSLTRLTLTRAQPEKLARNLAFYAHFPSVEPLDFKRCAPNLKSLRTVRGFVNPRHHANFRVVDGLPTRLESLTVFYDDTRNSPGFLDEAAARDSEWWFNALATAKERQRLPQLTKVVVLSREWRDYWDKTSQEKAQQKTAVVEPLREAFAAVGVEFRANLEVQWNSESWTD